MKQKSIALNTIVYIIKTISSMIFPLITFPYISRVLSPNGIGRYNFSVAFVSYFSLIASLGITTYAVREGAKIREDKEKFNRFASEIFSLNLFSTCVAYFFLGIVVFVFPPIRQYSNIILILSSSIFLTTIGTEWICSVYEDYVFIAIRSVFFQFVSLILMFVLVKEPKDVQVYAIISVIASAGVNLTSWCYVRKYYNHKLFWGNSIWKHLRPILVLFSATIASQIYVNSDTVMLGLLRSDYEVGIYAAATKIYNLVRVLLASFVTVLTPRMVHYFNKGDKTEYKVWLKEAMMSFWVFVIASAMGMICVARTLISLLCGEEYMDAVRSLQILAVAFIFSIMGSFIANEILIVANQEKKIFVATSWGATINILANFIMIPLFGHFGAAITTLMSEIIVFSIQLFAALKIVRLRNCIGDIVKPFIGSLSFFFIASWWRRGGLHVILELLGTIVSCAIILVIFLFVFKHTIVDLAVIKVREKFGDRKCL